MLHNLYFPQNSFCFITLSFFIQIILTFFINQALKYKYQPGCLKVYIAVLSNVSYVIILVPLWLCTAGFYGGYTKGNPVIHNANCTIISLKGICDSQLWDTVLGFVSKNISLHTWWKLLYYFHPWRLKQCVSNLHHEPQLLVYHSEKTKKISNLWISENTNTSCVRF
jgi:hypothetical protein